MKNLRIAARVFEIGGNWKFLTGDKLQPRIAARVAARHDLFFKIGAGIGYAVIHDADLAGQKLRGISTVVLGENDAEFCNIFEPLVSEGALPDLHPRFQPLRQAGRMPMQDDPAKKRTAKQHHDPVAVKGRMFSGGGNVIHRRDAVTEPAPDRLQAITDQREEFAKTKIADVLQFPGDLGIDVVALDAEGRLRRKFAVSAFSPVAAEAGEHELNHVALPMVRRRRMRKDQVSWEHIRMYRQ